MHALRDHVFHAELQLDDGTRIDARTSDAVVLALQHSAAIEVGDTVLAAAGIDPGMAGAQDAGPQTDDVDAFRRFLDTAVPDDFDDPEGGPGGCRVQPPGPDTIRLPGTDPSRIPGSLVHNRDARSGGGVHVECVLAGAG
ncbi:bifunctional nuclease domain-containing protein [Pseudonocardia alni]|uniref:bifunctional nuclease domain-containing protein n=1 Tax=Pseudonocardia alni TaxID=33907 RepID=UPI0027DC1195|nr:bifunctional nuclease domain-containing protein [Pseudonocardia alni]MBO4236175.1 hypothetical protein [Pseudonocardia alni]